MRALVIAEGAAGAEIAKLLRKADVLVDLATSAESALSSIRIATRPDLILCTSASALDGGTCKELRMAVGPGVPLVLMTEAVEQQWKQWLLEGLVDDLIPPAMSSAHLELRLETLCRTLKPPQPRRAEDYVRLKQPSIPAAMEGVHSRTEMLSLLFRETDRVQRMGTCLTMILCGTDVEASRTGLSRGLRELLPRLNRLLRSYDLLGEVRPGALLIALPGCQEQNALRLAERARTEVFAPAGIGGADSAWAQTCFGVVESCGRSPLTVLREAEVALSCARAAGPGSIRLFCPGKQPTIPERNETGAYATSLTNA